MKFLALFQLYIIIHVQSNRTSPEHSVINAMFDMPTHPPETLDYFYPLTIWIIDFTLICDITWVKGEKNYIKPRFKFVFTLES